MTPEEYEDLMLKHMLGKGPMPDAPTPPATPAKADRRLTVAPIPSSMNGNDSLRKPWGYIGD